MRHIDDGHVQTRYSSGLPRVLELLCPYCLQLASFETRPWQEHGQRVAAAEARCTRCEESLQLIQFTETNGVRKEQSLYAHPGPASREAMPGVDHLRTLSPALGRSYDTALKLYNRGDWAPAALTVRHLLQELLATLLSEDKEPKTLPELLHALPEGVDLTRPLGDSVEMLLGNKALGHEFDEEGGVGETSVRQLVDLVELLLDYLVVTPGKSAGLKRGVENAPVPLRRSDQS